MSALGQKQTLGEISGMPAFAGHADMKPASTYDRCAPEDDKFSNVFVRALCAYSAPGIWCGGGLCKRLTDFLRNLAILKQLLISSKIWAKSWSQKKTPF